MGPGTPVGFGAVGFGAGFSVVVFVAGGFGRAGRVAAAAAATATAPAAVAGSTVVAGNGGVATEWSPLGGGR